MFKRLISAALVFGASAVAPPALAQNGNCMPRDALVSTLTEKYGESLSAAGLHNTQQLVEVWSSPKTGSFTVIITQSSGISCVVATGENWSQYLQADALGTAS